MSIEFKAAGVQQAGDCTGHYCRVCKKVFGIRDLSRQLGGLVCRECFATADVLSDAPVLSADLYRSPLGTFVSTVKESNPKDAIGSRKVPFSTVPAPVVAEIGLAMLEGACKYRRHNYRVIGVRASVYYDAAMRHLTSWWEGEDVDPASGLSHIVKALSSLVVLRDAMHQKKVFDDRPPSSPKGWVESMNTDAARIVDAAPQHLPPYTREDDVPQFNLSAQLQAQEARDDKEPKRCPLAITCLNVADCSFPKCDCGTLD